MNFIENRLVQIHLLGQGSHICSFSIRVDIKSIGGSSLSVNESNISNILNDYLRLRKRDTKKPVNISSPERLIPKEKCPKSAMVPISAGTAPPPRTKAMGMVKETATFLFSGELMKDKAEKPAG